jgi:prevent-host-death family protein
MTTATVSIGQVKRDISELVNRVAYRGEHIVLTSRGKPKAVLISVEEFERFMQQDQQAKLEQHRAWMDQVDQHVQQILARRGGEMIDADMIWEASRADLEGRNDFLLQK